MELWAPFALRRDGPPSKQGYTGHTQGHKAGAVYHSAEGYLPKMIEMLDDTTGVARNKSWTFSNPRNGPLLQHYHLRQHTWANGGFTPNLRFFSVENEGVAGEPLTPSQINNLVDVTVWAWNEEVWAGLDRQNQLWEHNEMVQFGAAPTACPSGRIPWSTIIARSRQTMAKIEEMEAELDELRKMLAEQAAWNKRTEGIVSYEHARIGKAELAIWNTAVLAQTHTHDATA